jgi:hypothetical protein
LSVAFGLIGEAFGPQVITNVVRDSEAQQQAGRVKFMDDLRRDKVQLVDDLEDIAAVVTAFTEMGGIDQVRVS